ncbi:MAG TPA: class I SAM-dependent methyltransferase [Solirubrobacteraceae bacterium]|jgi:SAM-dependent methyltransferase|nr:class I SAM-dependent methyltransferase [Solirubrobacteraceae bacterium]
MTANTVAGGGVDDWDAHWVDYGDANERNPAQHYRRELALFLAGRFEEPSRLLDIGSGNGDLLAAAERRWPAARLAGLELSPAGVAESRRKVPRAKFEVRDLIRDPEPLSDDAGWATHAVCSEVLEHVDDPVLFLRNARGWLAPGCRVIVTVPGGPMSAFDRHIGHRRHFSPLDLNRVMSSAGLGVRLTAGAGFPFFNLYRSLVIARGDSLIDDATAVARGAVPARIVGAAMEVFRPLLSLSLPRSTLGWQTIGVAEELPANSAVR